MQFSDEANKTSKVALIRSETENAEQISEEEIRQMVSEAVTLTSGFSDIIKDGQVVVIKPNLISTRLTPGPISAITMLFSDPYKKDQIPMTANGITSDWRIAKVLVELIREINPSGKVYIMEGSGDGQTRKNLMKMGYTHTNIPGIDQFICMDESGDGYRKTESSDIVAINLKEKQRHRSLPAFLRNRYYFDKTYHTADVIISLCCLKNHFMTAITGGIKNVAIGATPSKIYGNSKSKINRGITINHFWKSINNYIHDSYICKPAQFVITDGLQGLAYGPTGQGSTDYQNAKMNMRLILASKDPVAIDTVHACLIGVDPKKIDYLRFLADEGYGRMNTSKITIVGNARVDQVKKPFPMAKGLISRIWNMPPKTQYRNFESPYFSINKTTLNKNLFRANLDISPSVTKVELVMGGQILRSIDKNFQQIEHIFDDSPLEIKITLCVYDRFFNCKIRTVHCKQQNQ